jgi:hypothetical protein
LFGKHHDTRSSCPEAGQNGKPKKKSKFIVESLEERIQRMEREELKNSLEEGYKVRRDEGLKIAEEFKPFDLEGWDSTLCHFTHSIAGFWLSPAI